MSDQESDFEPDKKKSPEPRSKSAVTPNDKKSKKQAGKPEKAKPKGKAAKGEKPAKADKNQKVEKEEKEDKKPKQEKGGKEEKGEKVAKRKKESKGKIQSKGKKDESDADVKLQVLDYMEKQNRPYNLLNVFDNLHGKIKKPQLELILNELADQDKLTCKEFGKNKVYYINQDALNVNREVIDQLGSEYSEVRAEQVELNERYKKLTDDYKKLIARKTISEIKESIQAQKDRIEELTAKRDSLMSEGSVKVDEQIVVKIQKEEAVLRKELNKRRRLVKECLSTWSEILQKKPNVVAELMGVEL